MAFIKIKDEFTDLPVSRQMKYQLRRSRQGCCTRCGKPVEGRFIMHSGEFKIYTICKDCRQRLCNKYKERGISHIYKKYFQPKIF